MPIQILTLYVVIAVIEFAVVKDIDSLVGPSDFEFLALTMLGGAFTATSMSTRPLGQISDH